MEDEKYIDHIKNLVAQNQGKYSDTDLIKEVRVYGFQKDSKDPGFMFAKSIINNMVKMNTLEMKTRDIDHFLNMNIPKRAFIGENK
jgi:hypothetical protein